MTEQLKALYQSVILPTSKQPFQYEKRPDAAYQVEANNPICGDRFTLYLDIAEDTIQDAAFYGHGCAISKSATSILTEHIIGLSLQAAIAYCQKMATIVDPTQALPQEANQLLAFAAARDFPERATCATLSWERLANFLSAYK